MNSGFGPFIDPATQDFLDRMLPRFLDWSAQHTDDPPMTQEELIALQRSMDTADEEDLAREAERQREATTHATSTSDLPTIVSLSSESSANPEEHGEENTSVDESYATLFQSIDGTEDSLTDTQSQQ